MAQQNTRARQQQKQRMMMILVVFLMIGGAAFYFLNSKPDAAKKVQAPPPKGTIAVPIAKKDIPLGTRISRQMVGYSYRAPRKVPTDALLAPEEIVGRHATQPILSGQYFQSEDIGVEGAVGGYSAMATPGKRLIVINANMFPGSIETLKVGDHVDLLAFQGFPAAANNGRRRNNAAVDGTQPGQRPRNNTPNTNGSVVGQTVEPVSPASATLIAENAEVMNTPKQQGGNRRRGGGGGFIVFQMTPQDAHVTSLMIASNVMMRAVFRPFADNTRLTSDKPPAITTRLPKAVLDPELIQVIANGKTYVTKPNSKIFLSEEEAAEMLNGKEAPKILYGKPVAPQENATGTKAAESVTKDEEIIQPADIEENIKQSSKTRKSAAVTDQAEMSDEELLDEQVN
jgi:Flp pilus assembly protein CpaB